MYRGKLVFSQVMEHLPFQTFHQLVAEYGGEYKVQDFTCLDQFYCMAFAQITYRESLRDIEACLRSQRNKLYHMGIRGPVSRNTIANANKVRNWRIHADLALSLIGTARRMYSDEPFLADLDETVYALDATTIDITSWRRSFSDTRRAAYTDAKEDKPGLAMLALGGVLFLDEIGDVPLELQSRLLKFVEEKTVRPLGWAGQAWYCPQLIVAATNKDLDLEVAEGRFRADLYARFKHRIHVPSLAERREGIPALVDFFLQDPALESFGVKHISSDALKKFQAMDHPENLRGLKRMVHDAAVRAKQYGVDTIIEAFVGDRDPLEIFTGATVTEVKATEYKLSPDSGFESTEANIEVLFENIRQLFERKMNGYSIIKAGTNTAESEHEDFYLDNEAGKINAVSASLRIRSDASGLALTLKQREQSSAIRTEASVPITEYERGRIMGGAPIDAPPYRLLYALLPDHAAEIKHKLTVRTFRQRLTVERGGYRRAHLRLDTFWYAKLDESGKIGLFKGPFAEIEIQGSERKQDQDAAKELVELLKNKCVLEERTESKYAFCLKQL